MDSPVSYTLSLDKRTKWADRCFSNPDNYSDQQLVLVPLATLALLIRYNTVIISAITVDDNERGRSPSGH